MSVCGKNISIILYGLDLILLLIVVFSYLLRRDEANRIFYIAALVVICSPIAIYVIILIIQLVKFMLVPIGDAKTWIGFSGSIVGGAMTLFAVIFTINHDKSAREKETKRSEKLLIDEKSQRLMPVIEIVERKDGELLFAKKLYGDNDLSYFFEILNVSENHAREINIQSVEYTAYDDQKKKVNLTENLFSTTKTIKILPSKRKNEFYVGLASSSNDLLYPNIFNQSEVSIILTIRITLYDIHKISQHSFITKVTGTLHENYIDPVIQMIGEYGERDGEIYNRFDLQVHSCITDIE